MDVTIKIIEQADNYRLISLASAKVMLGIDVNDATDDAKLQMLIDQNSAIVANLCDRVFALEKIQETWHDIEYRSNGSRKLYLTHAPVHSSDIDTIESPLGTVVTDYQLEEQTGKLILYNGGPGEIVVTYAGGYSLPNEAPLDLQQCTGLLVRQFRTEAAQAGTVGSGIRMIAHKDSRIMYHSPKDLAGATSSGSGVSSVSATDRALKDILQRYKRMWI